MSAKSSSVELSSALEDLPTFCPQEKTLAEVNTIVRAITQDPNRFDDLFQEGVCFLLRKREDHPGHTQSYYRQGCRYFLLDCLKNGRSVDSPKRERLRSGLPDESDDELAGGWLAVEENTRSTVSAHDLLVQLCEALTDCERRVLLLLAEGLDVSEIAHVLGVSHQYISKCRKRIASRAISLGVSP